jgi:hypothetical protein
VIVECKHCGAPLDVERSSAFARCSYCGHTNKVKSAKTLMAESPAAWTPPPVWQPPPSFNLPQAPLPYRPRPAPASKPNVLAPIVMGIVLLVGAGAALWASGAATTLPFIGLVTDGRPQLATWDLDAAATPPPVSGLADGSYDASSLGSNCRGYLTREPHVLLRTRNATAVQLDVQGSNVDLVMAVRTSAGAWICDDDSGGNRLPRIAATLPPGDHRVWVGTYSSSESSGFVLRMTASSSGVPAEVVENSVAPGAPPSIGALVAGAERLDGSWTGTTSGWVDASRLGSSCRGHVTVAPHLSITSSEPREIELVTRDNQSIDLVMVVRSPSGAFACDDDSGGSLNPRVRTTLEPGTTAVWVGVYHTNTTAAFTLELRELGSRSTRPTSQPALGAAPALGTVNLDVPNEVRSFRGTVRPVRSIRDVGSRCPGYVGASQDLVIATTVARTVTLRARGGRDLRIVSRGPDGQVDCMPGTGTADVVLTDTFAPGVHHVWVGTANRRSSPFELSVE